MATLHIEDEAVKLYHNLPALKKLLSEQEVVAFTKQIRVIEQTLSRWNVEPPTDALILKFDEVRQRTASVIEDVSQQDFERRVQLAKEYIRQGDVFQVVLSKRMRITKTLHPYVAYERLANGEPIALYVHG